MSTYFVQQVVLKQLGMAGIKEEDVHMFCVVLHKGVPETIFKLSLADIKEEDVHMFCVVLHKGVPVLCCT